MKKGKADDLNKNLSNEWMGNDSTCRNDKLFSSSKPAAMMGLLTRQKS